MSNEKFQDIITLLKEQLLAGEHVSVKGLGSFKPVHHTQRFQTDEKGRSVAHPPEDTIEFIADETGGDS
jgi:nucleoid DNA-binding protein